MNFTAWAAVRGNDEFAGFAMQPLPVIDNKSILTPTCGFLSAGFTHTVNAYSGCAFASSLCGIYCYAKQNGRITKGRPWGFYGAKQHVARLYAVDYDRIKRPRRGDPKPLRIYMSSSTDPYLPQERRAEITRSLLLSMLERSPDDLVIQTRSTLVGRDLELIQELSTKTNVWLCVTVETDLEALQGFPRHATSPAKRLAMLQRFRVAGVKTQATISPLLPLGDALAFADRLNDAADRVVIDHYLLGDGSPGGLRTKRTHFPEMLCAAGCEEWTRLEKFWEVVELLRTALGENRVLVSKDGFNSV
jgi:DNA repair photolyase